MDTTTRVKAKHLPAGFWGNWPEETRPGPEEELEVEITLEANPGYYIPANLYGHPDTWAPSEGEPAEVTRVWLAEGDVTVDLLPHLSSDAVRELESFVDEREADCYADWGQDR